MLIPFGGSVLFSITLWCMRDKLLGVSWRWMTATTLIVTPFISGGASRPCLGGPHKHGCVERRGQRV